MLSPDSRIIPIEMDRINGARFIDVLEVGGSKVANYLYTTTHRSVQCHGLLDDDICRGSTPVRLKRMLVSKFRSRLSILSRLGVLLLNGGIT